MISRFRLGFHHFARDMRERVPLTATFALAILAFVCVFAFLYLTGAHT